ncbi:MlaD family protein [Oxalobacteraceae bacterium A2-2]
MENRSYALTTGFFTITLLIAAVLFGLWFNRDRTERVPYLIATNQAIPGLNLQAPVRYRGLEVGKVGSITFNPVITGQILITLNINKDAPITRSTYATLGYQGVTGIAYIQLDDEQPGSPRLVSTEYQAAQIPLRPGFLDELDKRGKRILAQAEEATRRVNDLLNDDNRQALSAAVTDIAATAQAWRALPDQLSPTIAKLPALADKAGTTLDSLSAAAGDVKRLTGSLQAPGGPLERVTATVDRVGSSVEGVVSNVEMETLPHVNSLSDETRSSMRALRHTMNKINDRPQSLIFGAPGIQPGPGEEGFVAPTK